MATLIGIVRQVVGEAFAVAGDGTRRPLAEGDRVYAGEQLITGAAGSIAVSLTGGGELTLGRGSSQALDTQLLAQAHNSDASDSAATTPTAPSQQDLTDVQKLQAAIEAGVDPTQLGEATAAGGAPGAGGAGGAGGGHSFVLLGETGAVVDPTIGYPTGPIGSGPEFRAVEVPAAPDDISAVIPPDFSPEIEVEYQDVTGQIIVGPAVVDEEALADGTNPSSNAEQASGQIVINSPDGVAAVEILDVNNIWVNVTNGGVVQGQYGFLTVDAAGNWTYTLADNTLNHTNPNATGTADQVGEGFSVRMFDLDGDVSPTVSLNVLVNDDGPVLAQGESAGISVIVDEDELPDGITDGDTTDTTVSGAAGTLSALVNFGADGPGSFGLSGNTASLTDQGLTSGGVALSYNVIGNVLTANAGAAPIFTLTVGADGSYSFALQGPLDHPQPGSTDDDQLLNQPIDFSGVLTATDGDNDPVGAFGVGSFVINVEDDVPVLAVGRGEQGTPRIFNQVDEDELAGGITDGDATGTIASGAAGTLSVLVNFGADGPGSFGLSGNTASLTDQGLTSGGVALSYNVIGNVLTANAGAAPIFTLTVGADGSYSFALQGPLDHPQPGSTDDDQLLTQPIDFSGILTATDGDNDPVGAFGVGSFVINVEDDVPVLAVGRGEQGTPRVFNQVDEDELAGGITDGDATGTTASGAAGTLSVLVNFGADGPGSFGLSGNTASLTDQHLSSGGVALTYSVVGNVLTASAGAAPIFTLTVGADGSYSFALQGPLDHPQPGSTDDDQLLTQPIDFSGILTATDGDNDPVGAFGVGSFVINVEDDVPVLAVGRGEQGTPRVFNQVDEDELAGGITDGDATGTTASGAAGTLSVLVNFGADGPGSFGLSGNTALLTDQHLSSGGVALTYSVVGNVLTASAGATPIFTLTVGADGSYSFALLGPLDHPQPGSTDDDQLLNQPIDFSGVLTATDGDNDPVGAFGVGSFVINVEDDVPVLAVGRGEQGTPRIFNQVDEDELAGGITDGDATGTTASGAAGTLSVLVNFGADGPGSFGLSGNTASLTDQGLTSGGVALSYNVIGNVLTANAGAALIFTLTVGADGSYSFALQGPLDHPQPGSTDDDQLLTQPIDFSGILTATDGDNDPVSAFGVGSFVINVEDDVPVAGAKIEASAGIALDETAGLDTSTIAAAAIAGLFDAPVYGADGAGSTSYSLSATNGAATGLWLTGQTGTANEIHLIKITDTQYEGHVGTTVGGALAFTISINGASGAVTVQQNATLEHGMDGSSAAAHDDSLFLNGAAAISVTQTVMDGDGDTDSAISGSALSIAFKDDGPDAHADTIISGATGTVNLVLVLDSSGSIGSTNMATIKAAVTNLMNSYGNSLVKVMLVDFDTNAIVKTVGGQVWLSKTDAIAQLVSITSGGNTDYDDALAAVQDNYGMPPAADNTYVFFVSDGEPNSVDNGINATERAEWLSFLTNNDINGVYAVGIGSGVSQTDSDLRDVAWSPTGNSNDNVVLISTANQLSGTLTNLAQSIQGNVTGNDGVGADGWGAPKLISVEYGANISTFISNNSSVTINLGAGKGTLVIEGDGDYTFTPPVGGAEGAPVVVTYTIKDGDGDISSSTLTIVNPLLVVGSNASDIGSGVADTFDNHVRPNPTPGSDVDGIIVGGAGPDVLIGDVGGVTSGSYNLTFMIDMSGSIDSGEFGLMKQALNGLLAKFNGVASLHVDIGTFANGSQIVGTYTSVSAAQNAITGLTASGGSTNYEAALKTINTMMSDDSVASNKIVYFLTDGDPTSGNWRTTATIAAGMSSLFALSAAGVEINAVGIGLPSGGVLGDQPADHLNAIDNTDNGYLPVANFNDLSAGLGSLFVPVSVGGDNILGGDGNDVIFGDSIHSDNADGGWAVFVADNPGKTGGQLLGELYNNHALYGQEGSFGGNDTIDGGKGNDIIYGQGGDDTLIGGDGNDILYGQSGNDTLIGGAGDDLLIGGTGIDVLTGGLGNDTLTGGVGKDTFVWQSGDTGTDHVTDFQLDLTGLNSDVLDLSQLLSGEHANAGSLDPFLNFAFGAGNTTISVSAVSGGPTVQTIVLDGIDLHSSSYYGNVSEANIIAGMLNDNALKVDA